MARDSREERWGAQGPTAANAATAPTMTTITATAVSAAGRTTDARNTLDRLRGIPPTPHQEQAANFTWHTANGGIKFVGAPSGTQDEHNPEHSQEEANAVLKGPHISNRNADGTASAFKARVPKRLFCRACNYSTPSATDLHSHYTNMHSRFGQPQL